MILAKTPEEKKAAEAAHYEAIKNAPSDAEILSSSLNKCTTVEGEKVLREGEIADLDNGRIVIKKTN